MLDFHTSTHLRHVRTGIDQSINLTNPHCCISTTSTNIIEIYTYCIAIIFNQPQATHELFLWQQLLDVQAQDCRTTADVIWGGCKWFVSLLELYKEMFYLYMTPHLWHSSTKPAQANLANPIKLQHKLIKLIMECTQDIRCVSFNSVCLTVVNGYLHCFIDVKL